MGKWLSRFQENFSPEKPNQRTDKTDISHNHEEAACTVAGKVVQLHPMRPACKAPAIVLA